MIASTKAYWLLGGSSFGFAEVGRNSDYPEVPNGKYRKGPFNQGGEKNSQKSGPHIRDWSTWVPPIGGKGRVIPARDPYVKRTFAPNFPSNFEWEIEECANKGREKKKGGVGQRGYAGTWCWRAAGGPRH
jgi:hypothetical protein